MTDDPDRSELRLPIEVVPMGEGLITVLVRGDIDLDDAGELRAVLTDACTGNHRSVLVDMAGVHFIGSSGLGVLARLGDQMRDEGRSLVIRGCSPVLLQAFEVTGLRRTLDVS
ncbi:MAG: STAS domain-containing protein [Acidimicrobiales bacterium]